MVSLNSHNTYINLGNGIRLYRPPEPNAVDPSHPTIILMFGWMAAKLPHLQKYTSKYRERYPNTTVILTQCEPSFFWSTEYAQRKALSPLVETLEAIGLIPPAHQTLIARESASEPLMPLPRHRVLIHTFSNGGCCQLMTLSSIISQHQPTASSTLTSAIILDSCPGDGSFSSAQRAFSASASHPFIRILLRIIVTLFFCLQLIMKYLLRIRPRILLLRSRLNDPNILPWIGKNTPRLYIYSEGDEMVPAKAVEEHIDDVRRTGLNVRFEKFGKESKHVAHARTDPSRYWGAVERVWNEALV